METYLGQQHVDEGHNKGYPPLGPGFPPEEASASKFYCSGFAREGVVEVPQNLSIILHDGPERLSIAGTGDQLHDLAVRVASSELTGRLRVGLAVRIDLAVGHKTLEKKRFVDNDPVGNSFHLRESKSGGSSIRNVNMTPTQSRSLRHMEDGSRGGPECIDLVCPVASDL